jgi:hypothetical protein
MNRKNLSGRLKAFEVRKMQSDSDETRSMLVEVLARRDAVFFPWRTPELVAKMRPIQRGLLDGTRGVSARAAGRQEWKSFHASRLALIENGFCSAIGNQEVSTLRLLPLGEVVARTWVSHELSTPFESAFIVDKMRTLQGREFLGKRWYSESEVFGLELHGDPSDWAQLLGMVLPALTEGVLEANCDVHGRVFFSFTGKDFTEQPTTKEPLRPTLWRTYSKAFDAERSRLETLEPEDAAALVIPVRVA